MKNWIVSAKTGAAALALAGLMLAGCENGGGEKRWPSSGWVAPEWDTSTAKPAPKPAPAPAAKPVAAAPKAEPAPAPAPAVGDEMYLPTGDRATSALSIRCGMPGQVIAGNNFTYDIVVCNLTGMSLQNVVVNYSLDGARVVSSEPSASGSNFAVGDLAPRQCRTIKITANAAGTGSVRGCMGATWNNSLCCATTVVQPALKVVKSVTPENGTPCDSYTYKIVVTNTGTGSATNVKLTDNLPSGVTANNQSNLSWDIGTLAAGQSREVTFAAKAGKTGSFSNFANATADNNLSAKSNDVAIAVKQPVLKIVKQCPDMQRIGRSSAFKITVTNSGDAAAAGTVVEDTLPANSTFVSATDGGALQGGKVVWNVGTLAPGASKDLGLVLNVSAMGQVSNSATARATCAEPVSANCSFGIIGVPDFATLLTDDEGIPLVGANHTYRYEFKNQGQIALTEVKVKIELPAGLNFVAAQSGMNPSVAGQTQTYSLGSVPAGAVRQFTFTVKGTVAGEVLVVAEATCKELKTPVRDDEITNFIAP